MWKRDRFGGFGRLSVRVMARGAVSALLAVMAAGAGAVETIEPGDVLRVIVSEAPEFGRDSATVDIEGRIALPGLGRLAIAGGGVDAAREAIESALVERRILRAPTITVEIAAYRPVYVGGAVARPGAVVFEPGLTVRHALILAGGLDRGAGPNRIDAADLIELKAKWRARTYGLLEIDSRIARLRAEIGAAETPDFSDAGAGLVSGEATGPVIALDSGLFEDRMAARAALDAHLRDTLDLIDFEIDVLTRQGRIQEEAEALQREQLAKSRALYERGVLTLPRLRALEFDLSRVSREVLANRAFIARARQSKATTGYELESVETQRRIELRESLLDALGERSAIRAELEVLSAALLSAGVELAEEGALTPPEPKIEIHRAIEGEMRSMTVDLNAAIRPGDVIEVSIASLRRDS